MSYEHRCKNDQQNISKQNISHIWKDAYIQWILFLKIQKNNVIYHSNSMERWRRAFNKINPLFITKNTQHTMTKRKLFQQNRRHMWKTYNTCHTHGEGLRTLAKIRSRPGCISLPLLFSIFLEELSRANWQEKQIKGIEVGSKLCLYYVCKQME